MSSRKWLRSRPMLSLGILAVAGLALWLPLRSWKPSNPISQANFDRIELGMPQAELSALLGTPEYDATELGLVSGPESYSINVEMSKEDLLRRGFKVYRRQQWASREITIMVISDEDGNVVCRYRAAGHGHGGLAFLRSLLGGWF